MSHPVTSSSYDEIMAKIMSCFNDVLRCEASAKKSLQTTLVCTEDDPKRTLTAINQVLLQLFSSGLDPKRTEPVRQLLHSYLLEIQPKPYAPKYGKALALLCCTVCIAKNPVVQYHASLALSMLRPYRVDM